MNNSRPVSDDKRARVLAAIERLHYVPSAVARSLKSQATATIGLLVPNNTNPYFAEIARGIEGYFRRHGYCVFLCNSDNDVATQREYLRVLCEKRIDGLIIASAGNDEAASYALAHAGVPVVIVDRPIAGLPADFVQIDHEHGAALATRHLSDLGHTRIGCIAGPASTAVSAMRVAGFRRAMAERGLAVLPGAVVEGDFTSPGGYAARGNAVRDACAERDLRGQRPDGHRRAARGGRARDPRAGRLLDHRFRRCRAEPLCLSLAVDRGARRSCGSAKPRRGPCSNASTARPRGPMRTAMIEPRLIVRESSAAPAYTLSATHSSKQ